MDTCVFLDGSPGFGVRNRLVWTREEAIVSYLLARQGSPHPIPCSTPKVTSTPLSPTKLLILPQLSWKNPVPFRTQFSSFSGGLLPWLLSLPPTPHSSP